MSLQDRLPNGASVNRVFSDNTTELLALFQYSGHAEAYAKAQLASDELNQCYANSLYVVTCTYTGRISVFGPAKKAEAS